MNTPEHSDPRGCSPNGPEDRRVIVPVQCGPNDIFRIHINSGDTEDGYIELIAEAGREVSEIMEKLSDPKFSCVARFMEILIIDGSGQAIAFNPSRINGCGGVSDTR